VEIKNIKYAPSFPKNRPLKVVWQDGELITILLKIIYRRLVDATPNESWPLDATYHVAASLVGELLEGILDDYEIARWIPALSLLNWGEKPPIATSINKKPLSGLGMTDAFFRPLITTGLYWASKEDDTITSNFAIRLINLLQQNDLKVAIDLAGSRYQALLRNPSTRPIINADFGSRLAAALLIPIKLQDVFNGRERWLTSAKEEKNE
jgi:CRISPR-associated protein Csx17